MAVSQELISDVRTALRINHQKFDREIADLVASAKADLQLGGISSLKTEDENDPLIKRAIITYVKAEFGLDNADAEKYRDVYVFLKQHLMCSDDYIL